MSTVSSASGLRSRPPAPGSAIRLRQGAHLLGELLITLGIVVLLFVVYLVAWTNVRSDSAAAGLTDDLRRSWAADRPGGTATKHSVDPGALKVTGGKPFAIMTIP